MVSSSAAPGYLVMDANRTSQVSDDSLAVETLNLTRRYGDLVAVSSLNMQVHRGDLFGFIGSNGAGKTTTLRILSTFLIPSEGAARVLGHDLKREADKVRHNIGYMPDFFGVYKDMEVTEYLDFFGACYKIPFKKRETIVRDILELVGLSEKRGALIGALSRGMQQRLGLARVLVHDPQLLLLDEPASGLDPRARVEVMAILQELQKMGKTIIISSHILSELQNLCNRVAIIEKGKLIYCGSVSGVTEQTGVDPVVWVEVNSETGIAVAALRQLPEVIEAEETESRIRVVMQAADTDISCIPEALVRANVKLVGLRRESVDLEDVYLQVTRGETQ